MRLLLTGMIAAGAMLVAAAAPAGAQATRTWVSGVGDDVNPCSRTAPCKTFAGAISKTAANGEISVLDPGGFGSVTITKPISIVANGDLGSILSSLVNGIIINIDTAAFPTAPRRVYLEGLEIDGAGNGQNGIRILGADSVVVRNSSIRNHRSGTGIGIDVQSSLAVDVVLDNVAITGNLGGINIASTGPVNRVFMQNSRVFSNSTFSLRANGSGARAILNNSMLRGTPNDIDATNSAAVWSYQNNVIGNGTPTNPLTLK